jgi:hypothetical protein
MLVIREQQIDALSQVALDAFEDEMVAHSKAFTPRLCKVLGEEQLRVALRQAMERARTYGFTNRGPVRLYIDLMFLYGSDFDTDQQYPTLGEVLNASGDQMLRAEQLYQYILEYKEKVSGDGNTNIIRALENLSEMARAQITFTPNNFEADMLQRMARAFPQKAAYIGKETIRSLIRKGRTEAQKCRFPTLRGEASIVTLMFAFGHGCTHDPLYPWISRTLDDEKIKDSAARADRLERRALTWLDHVIGEPRKGRE